jgi:thiol-disulfide isomerase/thioredoxin
MLSRLRCALAVSLLVLAPLARAAIGPGDLPPDFLGHDRDGHDVRVSAMHGKVVLVTFWASWCGYCLKELPILAGIQKLAGPAQLQVVAISHDEELETFMKLRRRMKNLSLILTFDGDKTISKAYGVNGIPHMVMIGRDGHVAYVHSGYDESMLGTITDEVNTLLAAPAPANAAAP